MSLIKRSGIYLSSNILNALVPFILLPILTRELTPGEYGQIAIFQTLVSGLAAFTGLNTIGAATLKYYDKNSQNILDKYNSMCMLLLIASAIFLFVLAMFFSGTLGQWLEIPSWWVYLAILISSGTFIIQFRLTQWQIRGQAITFGVIQVSQSISLLLITLWFLYGLHQGMESRINALFLVTIVYSLICIVCFYKDKLLAINKINFDFVKDAWSYGVPLIPHVVGIFLLSSLDRVVINTKLGSGSAGIYMLGVQLGLSMVVVFDALNKALLPWLFRVLAENSLGQIKKVVRFTYLYFLVLLFLGLLSFVVGPYVINIVAGKEFTQATTIIGWLCLGQAFNGMYLMVTNYIFYAKATGRLSLITITCGIVNVLLLIVMISDYGIVGASVAFASSMLIRFLCTWWLAVKVCGFSWSLRA